MPFGIFLIELIVFFTELPFFSVLVVQLASKFGTHGMQEKYCNKTCLLQKLIIPLIIPQKRQDHYLLMLYFIIV